ncbi:hypothetical protein B0A55_05727 [Friedmanniomyces simplex]|uniref:Uncharacterized protein n=1 Tax=Friedmanniomyces simplex TaxID=329884 RepID=A0A4U0X6B7_9PEZI|nr:hypothetical protein B0A55_05727 [Friedmanniomyces simplex]
MPHSSGFGSEFIKDVLRRGDKAIATARNVDRLKDLADLSAATLQLDVTSPMSELQAEMDEAVKIYGRIDELGDDLLKQFQTNVFGAINVVSALMPHWRERKSGFLVVNSSYQSQWGLLPLTGACFASKAALDPLLGYIKTLTLNAGHFRTDVTAPEKLDTFLPVPSKNYQHLKDGLVDLAKQLHRNQPGDTRKAVELTVDMVRGEGKAKGRQIPARTWLGIDAYREVKAKCEEDLRILEEWKDAIEATDVSVNGSC